MACNERIESLLPDYHLDQLSEIEAEEVRRALAESAECRERLEEIGELLDLVPFAAPQAVPPDDLKGRVLSRVASATPDPARRLPPPVRQEERRDSRLVGLAPYLAAAVMFASLIGLALAYWDLRENNRELQAQVQRLESGVGQPGAGEGLSVVPIEGTGDAREATGTVVVSPATGNLALDAYNLPTPPTGHSYHAWLVGPDGDASLGEMELESGSEARMAGEAPGSLASYEALEVTVEPIGESGKTGPVYLRSEL